MSLLLAFVASAVAADCASPTHAEDVASAVTAFERAWAEQAGAPTVAGAFVPVQAALECLGEPVPPAVAARVLVARGMVDFGVSRDLALAWFRAAAVADPGAPLPGTTIGDHAVLLDAKIVAARAEVAARPPATVPAPALPSGWSFRVDGHVAAPAEGLPLVAQLEEGGTVRRTSLLDGPEALVGLVPAPSPTIAQGDPAPLPTTPVRERPPVLWLGLAGASAVAAVATYVVALDLRDDAYALSARGAEEVPDAEVADAAALNHGANYAAAGATILAVGFGAVAVVRW